MQLQGRDGGDGVCVCVGGDGDGDNDAILMTMVRVMLMVRVRVRLMVGARLQYMKCSLKVGGYGVCVGGMMLRVMQYTVTYPGSEDRVNSGVRVR